MNTHWAGWTRRIFLWQVLLGAAMSLAACSICEGGQAGAWNIRTKGEGIAEKRPEFRPTQGDLLRIKSDADSTARADSDPIEVSIPYQVSWWVYVTGERYDDLVIYQAKDEGDDPTDLTVMLREHVEKMPENPAKWHGMVWVQDAEICQSVANFRRPGWHRVGIARKSDSEVDLVIDGEVIGTYPARSEKPARRIELGDFSASDGAGEAYWGQMEIAVGAGAATEEISVSKWEVAATGAGTAEVGGGFEKVRQADLYLRSEGESSCEAEWGQISVEAPYHFECQVYVFDEPYRDFSVICPLGTDGQPTDIQIVFDDEGPVAGSEDPQEGFVWVIDAEGRHSVGSLSRGVWHDFAISRDRGARVALFVDGKQVKIFASRSPNPVAAYRFGEFDSESSRGEAYWYRIRLLPLPKT